MVQGAAFTCSLNRNRTTLRPALNVASRASVTARTNAAALFYCKRDARKSSPSSLYRPHARKGCADPGLSASGPPALDHTRRRRKVAGRRTEALVCVAMPRHRRDRHAIHRRPPRRRCRREAASSPSACCRRHGSSRVQDLRLLLLVLLLSVAAVSPPLPLSSRRFILRILDQAPPSARAYKPHGVPPTARPMTIWSASWSISPQQVDGGGAETSEIRGRSAVEDHALAEKVPLRLNEVVEFLHTVKQCVNRASPLAAADSATQPPPPPPLASMPPEEMFTTPAPKPSCI